MQRYQILRIAFLKKQKKSHSHASHESLYIILYRTFNVDSILIARGWFRLCSSFMTTLSTCLFSRPTCIRIGLGVLLYKSTASPPFQFVTLNLSYGAQSHSSPTYDSLLLLLFSLFLFLLLLLGIVVRSALERKKERKSKTK